jgi:hypothetical protein
MLSNGSKCWRTAPRCAFVLIACVGIAMPVHARAKVKEEVVTPQHAAEARVDPQAAARALREIGNPEAAGMRLDEAAAHWGDPILYMDAAEAWLAAAKEKREVAIVDAAEERVHIAVDILYFHLDSSADKNFRMVDTTDLPGLIARADEILEQAESVRAEIAGGESEAVAVTEDVPKKKKRRNRKADKAMFISGAALTAVAGGLVVMGAAGLVIGAVRQKQAERPDVLGQDYDAVAAQGDRGNMMAKVGFALGGVALAAGVTLMLVAKRKDRRKRVEDGDTMVRLSPTGSRSGGGVVLSGRF